MELSDILSLVKAGYTREEINQMENPKPADPDPVPVPQPVAQPVPQPVAQPVPQPVAQPVPQPVQQEAQPSTADLMQSIAKLTSAVQANAIAQSRIPPGGANPQTPTAEDMIAEIIRPTYKARGV